MPIKQLPPNPIPLSLADNIKMNGIPTKIEWKIQPFFILYFKVILINICKISHQIFYFLFFYISFYISRHHFSQNIRTSFNIIWKKDFRDKSSFFNGFTHHPILLNGQNPLSVTKVFCLCSLNIFFMPFYW